jgi:hypothetical protein
MRPTVLSRAKTWPNRHLYPVRRWRASLWTVIRTVVFILVVSTSRPLISAAAAANAATPPSQSAETDASSNQSTADDQAPGAMDGYAPRPAPAKPLNSPSGYASRSGTYSANWMEGYSATRRNPEKKLTPTYTRHVQASDDLAMPKSEERAKAKMKAQSLAATKLDAQGIAWTFLPSVRMWKNAVTGQERFQVP